MGPTIAYGQYHSYKNCVNGFILINKRYRFNHWRDKSEWHGDHGILKEDKVKFYIQLIF